MDGMNECDGMVYHRNVKVAVLIPRLSYSTIISHIRGFYTALWGVSISKHVPRSEAAISSAISSAFRPRRRNFQRGSPASYFTREIRNCTHRQALSL